MAKGKYPGIGAGKGSKPRPVNKQVYDSNYDEIDWTKKKDKSDKCEKIFFPASADNAKYFENDGILAQKDL
jgi:hypothetical protein